MPFWRHHRGRQLPADWEAIVAGSLGEWAYLDSDEYVGLLDRLVEAGTEPKLTLAASAPAAKVLPDLVAVPWKRLRRDARRLGAEPADEELHALRIRAKRARYAAEAAAVAVREA